MTMMAREIALEWRASARRDRYVGHHRPGGRHRNGPPAHQHNAYIKIDGWHYCTCGERW